MTKYKNAISWISRNTNNSDLLEDEPNLVIELVSEIFNKEIDLVNRDIKDFCESEGICWWK